MQRACKKKSVHQAQFLLQTLHLEVGPDDGNQHPLCLEAKYLKSYFKMMVISIPLVLILSISEFSSIPRALILSIYRSFLKWE